MKPPEIGRTVVTGAGGFIGGRLLRRLIMQGVDVRGWHRSDVNLVDSEAVAVAMTRDCPQTIFHLAAAGVSRGQEDNFDIIRHDLAMVENLLAFAPEESCILVAGSLSEYGRSGRFSEGDVCTPTNAYGIAKLTSGLLAAAYGARSRHTVKVARLFGVYGPGEAPSRFFPSLMTSLRARRSVTLSDGLQRRDFVHVDDACAAMVALASASDAPDVANIGTGCAVSVRDAAIWVAEALDAPLGLLRFGEQSRSPHDYELMQADVSLLCQVTGKAPPQRLKPGMSAALFDAERILDYMTEAESHPRLLKRRSAGSRDGIENQPALS